MKKLLKFLGLLLVAGALFMSCQQNVDISTSEINLSDGTWAMTQTVSVSYTDEEIKYSVKSGFDANIAVDGDAFTFKSVTENSTFSATVPSGMSSILAATKEKWEAEKEPGETITIDGNTITSKVSRKLSESELKEDYGGKYNSKHVEKGFDGAEIKTNKSKTEYKLTMNTTRKANGAEHSAKLVITFKKK